MIFPPLIFFLMVAFFLVALIMLPFLMVGLIGEAFLRLGISPSLMFWLLILTLVGSLVNIPIYRFENREMVGEQVVSYFGMRYRVPRLDRGQATVLAVNVGDTKEFIESYAKNNALTFTLMEDKNSNTFKLYQAFGFPTSFILDKNGIVREKILGDIPTEKLQALVLKQFKIQKEIEANYEKIHSR
jgi:hypothetical protein